MNLVWTLTAARAVVGVVARAVSGRYGVWDWVADWATDGDYSHQKAAAAAGRIRVAHLEAEKARGWVDPASTVRAVPADAWAWTR